MRVVLTGGGTGGHLGVAKAFLEALHQCGVECAFIGSMRGWDRQYFAHETKLVQKWFLQSCSVVDKKGFASIKALWQMAFAFKEACSLLRAFKPDCVLCVGGYSAAPASFGAVLLRIPLIIHEQNAKIGRLNRVLKPFAKLFFSSYLKESPILFYPVLEAMFQTARVRSDVKRILFMGGSQGALAINNFALGLGKDLQARGIKILCQSGSADFKRVVEGFAKEGLKVGIPKESWALWQSNAEESALEENIACIDTYDGADVVVFSFSTHMEKVYAQCDFSVCRSGASSLWELCANGLPALFIPYPYAAGNHQFYNAEFIVQKGLGFLCLEEEFSCNVFWESLAMLQANITQISTKLQKECARDAVQQMCAMIIHTVHM